MKFKSIEDLTKLPKELVKAYTEGIYADTPANRKLGRVGMSYKQWSSKQVGKNNEGSKDENSKKFSITNIKVSKNWIYDTYKGGIKIEAKINDHAVEFDFMPASGIYPLSIGIDCNGATIDGKEIYNISKKGTGGRKSYELFISSNVLKSQPKVNQKDFLFTGQYYSTKSIIPAFREKMQKMMKEDKFSEEFLNSIKQK